MIFLARSCGYRPIGSTPQGEGNFVRSFHGMEYPRFHLYIKNHGENAFLFSLHLDQKKPSYAGSTAHSGEYQGELVEAEAERIKHSIERL